MSAHLKNTITPKQQGSIKCLRCFENPTKRQTQEMRIKDKHLHATLINTCAVLYNQAQVEMKRKPIC